jgi:hypothetical protein
MPRIKNQHLSVRQKLYLEDHPRRTKTNPLDFPVGRIKPFGLLFAHLDDDTTHVMAALGANGVSWCNCATLRAHMKLTGLLGMVGSTLARS